MKYQEWKIPYGDTEIPQALVRAGFSPLLAALLAARGLSDPDVARHFLCGGAELLEDPLLLTDISPAVARITRAREAGEKIAIYGDYDVDGITAGCLMTDYLRSLGLDCELYIPDRIEEGYGLNTAAIEALHGRGVCLIITVDCGVTAIEEAAFAASLGVDMIITDHHECRETLPDVIAVVDPKRPDCRYPSRDLAGVGVAFKLVCAIDGDVQRTLERYADLVAIGTIADVMPMTGENRYMIQSGMAKIQSHPRPGVAALMEEAGVAGRKLTSVTIGFSLAPRLNAAGRLGRVDTAVRLLLSGDRAEAAALAAELCQMNRDRQGLEQVIWEQATAMLEGHAPSAPIVLASEGWHQGVIGIAASRITEEFSLPTVIICLDGDHGKGSCRSIGDFNLFDALSACSGELVSFGGHAMAAGLNIRSDRVDAFRRALGEYYATHPPETTVRLTPDLNIEDPALLSMHCVESLDLLEPCGNGNPRPLLCITGAYLESVTPIGGGKHLRLRVSKAGQSFECVFFSHREEELGAAAGDFVDLAFSPQINEFRLRKSVQLVVTDLRRYDGAELRTRLLDGGLSRLGANEILPDRQDFAKVWRAMTAAGGHAAGDLLELRRSLHLRMHPGKLLACILVFRELGLLQVGFTDVYLDIIQTSVGQKADLHASVLLCRIAELAGDQERR
jgi:single-stranded-DNA-specific exonuclease